MIAVIRLLLPAQEQAGAPERFRTALAALTAQSGCVSATAARSIDDPAVWVLSMRWQSVGAYRRALSAYDVKLNAVPLLHHAMDEPSAFEELLTRHHLSDEPQNSPLITRMTRICIPSAFIRVICGPYSGVLQIGSPL